MIGVPGSGKSYMAGQIGELLGLTVLSSDAIREELSNDAADQRVSEEAWQLLYERASQRIGDAESVIIDGTNTVAERRQGHIAHLRKVGARAVIGLYIYVAPETAKTRNRERERVVPDDVIDNMQSNLDKCPPSTADGFNYVITINND